MSDLWQTNLLWLFEGRRYFHLHAEICYELFKDFENKGEYEEAREMLRGFWPRIDQRPRVKALEPNIAAEMLMRAGVLTGWMSG